MSGGHQHGSEEHEQIRTRKLALVAGINLVEFVVELLGGLAFGSLTLLSDAFHMLFDVLAYAVAFAASYTAERYDRPGEWSYGLHRLEPIVAFLNGALLLPMAEFIVYEAYQRFLDPVMIDPDFTIVLASGGLLVNLRSVYLDQGGEMNLNEEGAFYYLVGNTGASITVIVSTALIAAFDLRIADPLTAVLIALVVAWSAVSVLSRSSNLLLERSPIPHSTVIGTVEGIDGVEVVVDVCLICSRLTVATLQVQQSAATLDELSGIRKNVHDGLTRLGIDHATVELVTVESRHSALGSHGH
ncbi:cation diffusion facilitator family transporter [Halomarina pelagica]|uniref:cation diffusion facilitator family transporter n=1 Tax=Halomarina pelagica TaxID=2961599 RepID=UPI0020C3E204|nr:cation diffusion facilitator family transporter [Halomarina sp. BND7]